MFVDLKLIQRSSRFLFCTKYWTSGVQ